MRRVSDSAASPADSPESASWRVAFPMSGQGRHAGVVISEVNTWPACTPIPATPAMLPSPAQDAGPRRLARPFSYGSFIHTSQPVLTGAFPDTFPAPTLAPRTCRASRTRNSIRTLPWAGTNTTCRRPLRAATFRVFPLTPPRRRPLPASLRRRTRKPRWQRKSGRRPAARCMRRGNTSWNLCSARSSGFAAFASSCFGGLENVSGEW